LSHRILTRVLLAAQKATYTQDQGVEEHFHYALRRGHKRSNSALLQWWNATDLSRI